VAFDLKEMQWSPVKLSGDTFAHSYNFSISIYGHNQIMIYGCENGEGALSILSLTKVLNEIHASHDQIFLQDLLSKNCHLASIFGTRMYLYGEDGLSFIDLKTLEVNRNCPCSGQDPGGLQNHKSLLLNQKIYMYGGYVIQNSNWARNQFIYVLEIETLKWERLTFPSAIHGTAQVYKDNIYFYGGAQENNNNYLSIFNTSKNFWYQILRRGEFPPSGLNFFSAVYGNKMIVFGGSYRNNYNLAVEDLDPKRIYGFNLEIKPVNDLVGEISLERALDSEQENKNSESLKEVQKLLEEKKDHDVIFIFQEKQIPAHKDILSLRSSYFSNMFSSGMQESHQKEIPVSDISVKAFEALLEYLYQGTLPTEEDIVKELIGYSEKILLKRLRIHCERTLANLITQENVVEFYELSKVLEAEDLKEAALQFMGKNLSYFADQLNCLMKQPEKKDL